MKSIKKIAALCLILFFSALSFAETETISVENSRLNINVFTLKNGLTFLPFRIKQMHWLRQILYAVPDFPARLLLHADSINCIQGY